MRREWEDALNAIADSRDIAALQPMIDRLGRSLGFACCSYIDLQRVPLSGEALPFYVTTVPADFVATYIAGDFVGYDPVVRRAATGNSPFLWSDCLPFRRASQPHRGVKGHARRLLDLATDFGFRQGYVVPCHGIDATGRPSSSFVSFYWPDGREELTQADRLPIWLRLAGALYHERMLALRGLPDRHRQNRAEDSRDLPVLSDRELECLVWACRGKTNPETAEILGIASRTVEFHVANAMRKLGVFSKIHAVAVAIHLGLISP